jgi:orotate phosphoribosyltransferase-like protein
MKKEGLSVSDVMNWLNVSKSYVYYLIRNEELETTSHRPVLVSPSSVFNKIGNSFPRVTEKTSSLLDYHIRQDALKRGYTNGPQ